MRHGRHHRLRRAPPPTPPGRWGRMPSTRSPSPLVPHHHSRRRTEAMRGARSGSSTPPPALGTGELRPPSRTPSSQPQATAPPSATSSSSYQRMWLLSTPYRVGAPNAAGGRTTTARSPMMTTLQPTWTSLVARQRWSLRPPQAHRLALSSQLWAVVVMTLVDRDLAVGGGSAIGRAHSWCAACLLG